jgi:hypothetical protein
MRRVSVFDTVVAPNPHGCQTPEPGNKNGESGKNNDGEHGKKHSYRLHRQPTLRKLSIFDRYKLGGKRNTDGWKLNTSELRLSTKLG